MAQDFTLLRKQGFINGKWCNGDDGRSFEVVNPADETVITTVADMGAAETERAIAAAAAALPAWRALDAHRRAERLKDWYRRIVDHADELARLMTLEQGKPLAEALGEIHYSASFVEWFAEQGRRVRGEVIAPPANDRRLFSLRQPIGVVAAITPWNFPSSMITRKLAPALAVGCTVVVKPSELTPYSALALAALAEEAGIPPGVFNIVTGTDAPAIGRAMCASVDVRMVTFTGSSRVGKMLMAQCADTVKRVGLELGGNAPFIVFDDADISVALDALMKAKFRNSGQTCVCADRVLVDHRVHDRFVDGLAKRVGELVMGPGTGKGVTQGPMINQAALDRAEHRVADARAKGARVRCGGARCDGAGFFFPPTLITGATPDMDVLSEENFAPIIAVIPFKTEAEAIDLANDTPYGLAGYFCTEDYRRIFRVSEALEYGIVGVNEGIVSTALAPFGGVKESGLGREGGHRGIDEFLEEKYLCLGHMSF